MYMSPEQALCEAVMSGAISLSWQRALYLCAGREPFAEQPIAVLRQVAEANLNLFMN